MKKASKLKEDIDIKAFILPKLIASLVMMFVMFSIYLIISKRYKKQEKIVRELVTGKISFGSRLIIKIVESPAPNAFVVAFGAPVAFITRGLINLCDEREQTAVILHECSHLRSLESLKGLATEIGLVAVLLKAINMLGKKYGEGTDIFSLIASTIIVSIMFLLAVRPHLLLNITLGKRNEKKADDYTIKFGYGRDLVLAFEKMLEWMEIHEHIPKCTNRFCKAVVALSEFFDEHPPIRKRIESVIQNSEVWEAAKNGKTSEIVATVKSSLSAS